MARKKSYGKKGGSAPKMSYGKNANVRESRAKKFVGKGKNSGNSKDTRYGTMGY